MKFYKYVFKNVGNVKILKAPAVFMTYRFVNNAIAHCATLLGNFGKEEIYDIILDFIVYFNTR